MDYYSAFLLICSGLGLSMLSLYFFVKLRREEHLQKLRLSPFKDEYREYLKHTPHYVNLSKDEQQQIEKSILLFIDSKEFIGVSLDVSDEMKVIIAFYACILLLHKTTTNCYDSVKTIIIYPTAVALESIQASGGIYQQERFFIDGQATVDTVVIIWHDAKKEAYHLRHNNVIIHEFTHEIDLMTGEIDGVPPIERSKYDSWVKEFYGDYKKLNKVTLKNRGWGRYKLLGSYAATNEAEFFAVVTERFFESPKSLQKHFPELYKELKDFFNIDTLSLVKTVK